jgi:hypothetical protein
MISLLCHYYILYLLYKTFDFNKEQGISFSWNYLSIVVCHFTVRITVDTSNSSYSHYFIKSRAQLFKFLTLRGSNSYSRNYVAMSQLCRNVAIMLQCRNYVAMLQLCCNVAIMSQCSNYVTMS